MGSNLGDRADALRRALRLLDAGPSVRILGVSSLYESAPVGIVEQPDFFNLVAQVATTLDPPALLARCLEVEAALGRVRRERWGPRLIDIDVLLFGTTNCRVPALTLPHPRMLERCFVMVPLAELSPQLRVVGRTVTELASQCATGGLRNCGAFEWREDPPATEAEAPSR